MSIKTEGKMVLGCEDRSISYSGPDLCVDDVNVLQFLFALLSGAESDSSAINAELDATELLAALGWDVNTHSSDRLEASLVRLSCAHLNVQKRNGPKDKRVTETVRGTLLRGSFVRTNERTPRDKVSLNISTLMLQIWQELINHAPMARKIWDADLRNRMQH